MLSSSETFPEKLVAHINAIKANKESFSEAFARLGIESDDFTCSIIFTIPNIPVFIDGHLYNFSALEKLKLENVYHKNPTTRENFTWNDVNPGRAILKYFEI